MDQLTTLSMQDEVNFLAGGKKSIRVGMSRKIKQILYDAVYSNDGNDPEVSKELEAMENIIDNVIIATRLDEVMYLEKLIPSAIDKLHWRQSKIHTIISDDLNQKEGK